MYSFFIFDRHTECIYQKRWAAHPSAVAPAANGDAVISPAKPETLPASKLNSAAGTSTITGGFQPARRTAQVKRADDAKLLFGVVFSLRNIVRRLGGQDDEFISYTTGEYKLHYYETPTSLKFCMMTDLKTNNLRVVLHQIWVNLYVEYVVRNPLSPAEHPGGVGVNNELFELGLDRFVVCITLQLFITASF